MKKKALLFAILIPIAACKRPTAPAACTDFQRTLGMTPGVLTVKPSTVFSWSCDGKKFELECHIEDAKHACTCTHATASGGTSTDAKFGIGDGMLPEKDTESRTFANQRCGWSLPVP